MPIDAFLASCGRTHLLVVGDVMVDAYLWGRVDRISPEAPVPVVQVTRRSARLGGAANVALNAHALGATATVVTVIGDDADAGRVEALARAAIAHRRPRALQAAPDHREDTRDQRPPACGARGRGTGGRPLNAAEERALLDRIDSLIAARTPGRDRAGGLQQGRAHRSGDRAA
jgi:hypothetical protein